MWGGKSGTRRKGIHQSRNKDNIATYVDTIEKLLAWPLLCFDFGGTACEGVRLGAGAETKNSRHG
jgi:hypothetical protein